MNRYELLSGEVIEYPTPAPAVAAFLARVTAAASDPTTAPADVLALAYGTENPMLDTASAPGRALVTRAVFADPVYRIMADLVGRKQIAAAGQTREDVARAYTLTVKDTAEQLGLSETAVRSAITARKLSAMKRNGEWYVRPESVASYKVSNRGRKKKAPTEPLDPAAEEPAVRVRCGTADGASLSVRIAGAELAIDEAAGAVRLAHFPEGWTRAAIKTTAKDDGGTVRVFEVEPADAPGEVEHRGLYVRGAFRVVKKHNSAKNATAVWKGFA